MRVIECVPVVLLSLVIGCVPAPSSKVKVPDYRLQRNDDSSEPESPVEPGPNAPDAPEEFTTTESGLKYRILREGEGEKPTPDDTVRCHYRGTLEDGTVFDSSYQRGKPASFPLTGVIAGWTEGLQHVREGGKIELIIPYELAYGEQGRPPKIPPKAELRFIVELLDVN